MVQFCMQAIWYTRQTFIRNSTSKLLFKKYLKMHFFSSLSKRKQLIRLMSRVISMNWVCIETRKGWGLSSPQSICFVRSMLSAL